MLKEKISLVKLIHDREIFPQAGELAVVLKKPQTDRMECADIHVVKIDDNISGQKLPCNPVLNLIGGFFRESGDKNLLGWNSLVNNQVGNSLGKRKGLARAGASNDKNRAFDMLNNGPLLGSGVKDISTYPQIQLLGFFEKNPCKVLFLPSNIFSIYAMHGQIKAN